MDENDKRRIRKRTDIFEINEGTLYYNGTKANKEKKLVITADQKFPCLSVYGPIKSIPIFFHVLFGIGIGCSSAGVVFTFLFVCWHW
jgi:hypothetical protein